MTLRPPSELRSRLGLCLSDAGPHASTLICFPYAGGNAHVFRPLVAMLGDRAAVYGIQLPGRGMRLSEPPLTDMAEIVEALDGELAHLVEGPYALFGTSMGALVAFEWARSLRRSGARLPQCLMAVAARPPHLADPGLRIHRLPTAEFERALQRYGGTPEAVLAEPELMELMVPMLRADFTVVETYEHTAEPPLEVPIVALGGRDDRVVRPAELAGWARHTSGAYRELLFAGDHFFHRAPAVQAQITAMLSKALS